MTRVLVAGVGNIFQGDDAFGVEVAQRLARRAWPEGVKIVDFGIRGIDLTYALLEDWDGVILVDAAMRGEAPGTVSVIAPDVASPAPLSPEDLVLSGHDLDPAKALRLVTALGGECRRILLVACEPLTCGGEDGFMGLSPPVAEAIDAAIETIERLILDLRGSGTGARKPRELAMEGRLS
ncbi:MAG: hydrogenase maturation protease [Caulobacteraceae bacterium]